jgi:multimeric flavodoxin WrbA
VKILALVGSGRVQGNTARAVGLIKARLRGEAQRAGEALDFETVHLSRLDIGPCRGCRVCFDAGEGHCPLKDDLPALKERLHATDGLIVATPVYVDDVSGTVKTWMDRLAYACHRPEFAGHGVFLLATAGSGPTRRALGTLAGLTYMGYHITGRAGLRAGALSTPEEIEARHGPALDRAARAIGRDARDRGTPRPTLMALIAFRAQQGFWRRAGSGTVDHAYWETRGWLDPRRSYYTGHRASPLKTALARAIGGAVARFMS